MILSSHLALCNQNCYGSLQGHEVAQNLFFSTMNSLCHGVSFVDTRGLPWSDFLSYLGYSDSLWLGLGLREADEGRRRKKESGEGNKGRARQAKSSSPSITCCDKIAAVKLVFIIHTVSGIQSQSAC